MSDETKAAVMECAKAVCGHCAMGKSAEQIPYYGSRDFIHLNLPMRHLCTASGIRRKFPEAFKATV